MKLLFTLTKSDRRSVSRRHLLTPHDRSCVRVRHIVWNGDVVVKRTNTQTWRLGVITQYSAWIMDLDFKQARRLLQSGSNWFAGAESKQTNDEMTGQFCVSRSREPLLTFAVIVLLIFCITLANCDGDHAVGVCWVTISGRLILIQRCLKIGVWLSLLGFHTLKKYFAF